MPTLNPTKQLPAMRLAVGSGAYAMPNLAGVLFGLKMKDNHDAAYLGRLFAIRDLALGVGALTASPEGRPLWWQLGILCDAADAVSSIKMIKAGGSKRAGVLTGVTALLAVGLGVAALNSKPAA